VKLGGRGVGYCQSGCFGDDKNLLPPMVIELPYFLASNPVPSHHTYMIFNEQPSLTEENMSLLPD